MSFFMAKLTDKQRKAGFEVGRLLRVRREAIGLHPYVAGVALCQEWGRSPYTVVNILRGLDLGGRIARNMIEDRGSTSNYLSTQKFLSDYVALLEPVEQERQQILHLLQSIRPDFQFRQSRIKGYITTLLGG